MMTTGEVTSSERTISIKRASARDYLRRLVKPFRRTKSSESVTQSSALNTELTSTTDSLASANNGPGSVSSVATVTTESIQPEQNATSIVEDVEPRTYGPAPSVPAPPAQFLSYLSQHPQIPTRTLLQPYLAYEKWMRYEFMRSDSDIDCLAQLVPIYDGQESLLRIRTLDYEFSDKTRYLMPLQEYQREADNSLAIVRTFEDYQGNFDAFTRGQLECRLTVEPIMC